MKKNLIVFFIMIFAVGCSAPASKNPKDMTYDQVFKAFEEEIKTSVSPNSPITHYHIANTYLKKLHEIDKKNQAMTLNRVIKEYQICIAMDPLFPPAYYGLGFAYYQQKEYKKAMESLDKCLELNPHYSDANFLLGQISEVLNKPEQARAYYSKTIAINPSDIRATLYLATYYFKKKQYDKAKPLFEKALDINSTNEVAKKGLMLIEKANPALKTDKPAKENVESEETTETNDIINDAANIIQEDNSIPEQTQFTPEDGALETTDEG
jgi:tetratricopeptide (TPR) repeat protein